MKKIRIKLYSVVYAGLLFCLFLTTSCHPVVEATSTDKYDTLRFSSKYYAWSTSIIHIEQDNGHLRAFIGFAVMEYKSNNSHYYNFREYDSIPYYSFKLFVEAYIQDTLLPLGKYTTNMGDTCYISLEECCAFGAGSKLWYKSRGKQFAMEDATIYIGQDSKQEYYIDLFVQMKDGEKLYLRSTDIWRLTENSTTPYYSKQ